MGKLQSADHIAIYIYTLTLPYHQPCSLYIVIYSQLKCDVIIYDITTNSPDQVEGLLLLLYSLVAHAQRGIRIVCLCVCLHACVDCYSCFMINEMKVRASLGIQSRFLDFNYAIIMLRSRVQPVGCTYDRQCVCTCLHISLMFNLFYLCREKPQQ